MRLELGHVFINDVQFGDVKPKLKDGVLFINKEEMIKIISGDEH